MKAFIETMIKQLVDKPDEVEVKTVESDQSIIYELTVGDGDFGKVIGKRGRNISAIRTILFAINAKEGGKRARLEVIDKNEE
ncbi:MAG: KH domain-containing protein [Candidatus Marinimicrobia bacterium]|nr:KH domain-containing protein [Candidatus Neomarinimicrobiota bacterium]